MQRLLSSAPADIQNRPIEGSISRKNGHVNPGRLIFLTAWNRIWASKALWVWEIIFWSILAVLIGFHLTGFRFAFISQWPVPVFYLILVAFTPIIIGIWVYQTHYLMGLGDMTLSITPVSPVSVLYSRGLAIFLSWFKLFIPLMLALCYTLSLWQLDNLQNIAFQHLWLMNNNIMREIYSTGLNRPTFVVLIILAFIQFIGWITLPVCWGLLAGTILSKKRGSFFLTYFMYIILPALLIWLSHVVTQSGLNSINSTFADPVFWMPFSGLSGVILSAIFFKLAVNRWSKRDK